QRIATRAEHSSQGSDDEPDQDEDDQFSDFHGHLDSPTRGAGEPGVPGLVAPRCPPFRRWILGLGSTIVNTRSANGGPVGSSSMSGYLGGRPAGEGTGSAPG